MEADDIDPFVRKSALDKLIVAVVIPPSARLNDEMKRQLHAQGLQYLAEKKASDPAGGSFQFDYIDAPLNHALLQDGATHNNGVYEYTIREAVLGVFDLAAFGSDEFIWSFASNKQLCVLAPLKIGEATDVQLHNDFAEVLHVSKSYFPAGVGDTGYGTYSVQVVVDGLGQGGFRVVSSFLPGSKFSASRLPFFFGFKVFGYAHDAPELPLWRHLLGEAVRHAGKREWQFALINIAISVEAFIDSKLSSRLLGAGFGEDYVNHLLKIGTRSKELHELNHASGSKLSKKAVDKQDERLNEFIFTPRNYQVHGKLKASDVTGKDVVEAFQAAVGFFWDWGTIDDRSMLVTKMYKGHPSQLIDDAIVALCSKAD